MGLVTCEVFFCWGGGGAGWMGLVTDFKSGESRVLISLKGVIFELHAFSLQLVH